MTLALIQEKQNGLYCFHDPKQRFTEQEVFRLQKAMVDQNLTLLRGVEGADLAMTSEAVNFPGQPFRHDIPSEQVIGISQDYLLEACSAIARQKQMYLAVGMFRKKADKKLYNSVVVFDRAGQEIFSYDKSFLAGDETEYLTPGQGFPVWENEFGKIGFGICWDMQFPETARSYARQGADLILCPSWGWEEIYGRSRAYENGVYLASAMAVPSYKPIEGKRTPSEIVSPDGTVLAQGPREREAVVYCEIPNLQDCREYRSLRISCLEEWIRRQGK